MQTSGLSSKIRLCHLLDTLTQMPRNATRSEAYSLCTHIKAGKGNLEALLGDFDSGFVRIKLA